MRITKVTLRPVAMNKVCAIASIVIDDCFVVHDLRVVNGDKGLFVAMPSRKLPSGEFRDICHPINSDARGLIQQSVLDQFHREGGVAAWRNISAPHAGLSRPIGSRVSADLHAYYLLAPEPDWEERGVLTISTLRLRFCENLTGHLLWEWLAAGSYPEGQEENAHFLRWQVSYNIP